MGYICCSILLGRDAQLLRYRARPLGLPITLGPDMAWKNANISPSTKPTFRWWKGRLQVLGYVSGRESGAGECVNDDDNGSEVANNHHYDDDDDEFVIHDDEGNGVAVRSGDS